MKRAACIGWAIATLALTVARAAPWPEIASDLPTDPALRTGTLPNGLRYFILPNAEPKDRISLRLVVAAGSLHEGGDERGLAHFVEHMAFRGTRTHPGGSLIAALQQLGLGFGPDLAAFTNYDYTIYHLELPDASAATLRTGLGFFREYASEIVFDPAALEIERGVVQNEKATRNTPDARIYEANLRFMFPDSRQSRRAVIGTDLAIRNFTREQFIAFYDAWYRPERMAVIIVGRVDPPEAEKLLAAALGDLAPRAPAPTEPVDLAVPGASNPDVAIYVDRGLAGVSLNLEHPLPAPPESTHAERVVMARRALAFSMLHERLQKISHDSYTSFVSPSVNLMPYLPGWQLATIAASAKIDDWQRLASDLEREHRRAIQHGFTADELASTKAALASGFEESVRGSSTRNSAGLAAQLLDSLVHGRAFASPTARRDDLAADIAAFTLADCDRALRETWTGRAPHVFIATSPAFNITRQQIADAMNVSRTTTADAPDADAAPIQFGYEDFGPAGTIARDEVLTDLDAHLASFTNGVRLNFKPTAFAADVVDVHIRVGRGQLNQPSDQPGLDLFAEQMLLLGGLGQHTASDLRRLLSGHALRYGFSVDSDAFVFRVQCAPRDLRLGLQVVAAYLNDAAYRPEALRESQANLGTLYSNLSASPSGPISMLAPREMARGDGRFGIATPLEMQARTLQELITWLDPQLKRGAIELSIVGDTTWTAASAAVASTLGALRPRNAAPPLGHMLDARPIEPGGATRVFGIDPRLKQSTIACYWPVPDCKDIHQERRSVLLATILTERLRVHLRDELGASYASSASFYRNRGFPSLNYFVLYADVDQAHATPAMELVRREIAALAKSGPEFAEFDSAKKIYLHDMDEYLRTNAYWGSTVLATAQEHPETITAARDRAADIAAITHAELVKLAQRWLQPANALTFVTVPASQPTPTGGAK